MHYVTKEVTPADAQKLLDTRARNRSLSQDHVERLARDMKAGAWRLTGIPVVVNDKGELIDGQHRMAAVVLADISVTMTVCYGVSDPDASKSIDTGRTRKAAHILSMFFGVKHAARMAGIAKMLEMLERDSSGHRALSADEMMSMFQARRGMRWVLDTPEASLSSRRVISPILAAFAIAYEGDPIKAEAAFRAFYDNNFAGKNDPMNAIARWLDNPASISGSQHNRLSLARRVLTALAFRFKGEPLMKSYDGTEGMRYFGVKEDVKPRRIRKTKATA